MSILLKVYVYFKPNTTFKSLNLLAVEFQLITTQYKQLEEHSHPTNDLQKMSVGRLKVMANNHATSSHTTNCSMELEHNVKIRGVFNTYKKNSTILTTATTPQPFKFMSKESFSKTTERKKACVYK